jgi:hypothetical protein
MMIPAVRWSPGSGRLLKRGSSDSATFMRNVALSVAQPRIRSLTANGTAPSGSSWPNSSLG